MVRPGWHHSALRPTGQWPVLPGAVGTGACRRTRPIGPVDHNGRPSTTAESASVRTNNSRNAVTSTDPSASASHVLDHNRRNPAVKLSRTNVLRDPGPKVWHDDTDSNQPPAGERTERDPAVVDVVLELVHLGLDGVFAVIVRVPGPRAPAAVPRDELSAMLVVQHVDAFPTVDLDEARQLVPAQPSELDSGSLRLTLAHGLFMSSGPWPAAPG